MDLLAILIAFLIGIATGAVTGLCPGLHVNVAAALLAASGPAWTALGVPPLAAAVGLVTTAVSHAFFEAVPSLFLGVPSDEAYALLPAHRLVRRGRGLEALAHTLYGAMWGLALGLGVAALLLCLEAGGLPVASSLDGLLRPWMGWFLAGASLLLIATDRRVGWGLAVFLASGLLGLVVFASPLFPGEGAALGGLFPALTGLFGASGLVLALRDPGAGLPRQDEVIPDSRAPFGAALAGVLGGMAVGLLPGLGAGNAAAMASLRRRGPDGESSGRRYLVMVSSINLSDALFGIAALVLLQRSRSGASAALETFFPDPTTAQILALGSAMLAAGLICHRVLRSSGLQLARLLNRLHPGGLNGATLAFLVVLVAWTTGGWGLVLLAAATSLGLVAPLSGVRRSQAMGFFMVPTILFFSGRSAEVATALRLEGASLPPPALSPWWLAAGLALSVAAGLCTYIMLRRWLGPTVAREVAPEEVDALDASSAQEPPYPWPGRASRFAWPIAILVLLALLGGWAWISFGVTRSGATFQAQVLSLRDGDTLLVRVWPGRLLSVRLDGIDCPESDQPCGPEATKFASGLVNGRRVAIRSHGRDRYGRTLGRVFVDGTDLNLTMVKAGWAWHYKTSSSEAALARAETEARSQRLGLWRLESPVAPWEWRHPAPGAGVSAPAPPALPVPPSPGDAPAVPSATEPAPSPALAFPPSAPATLEARPAPGVASPAEAAGPYHGNTSSKVFHGPGCRNYGCQNCTAVFATRAQAVAAGYRQAGCCGP